MPMDPDDALHPESPLMTMSNSFLNDGMLSLSMPGPSRDQTYYIPDGNTVMLVENTLFRVSACRSCWFNSGSRTSSLLIALRAGTQINTHEGQVRV